MHLIVLLICLLFAHYQPKSSFYLRDFDTIKTPHFNPLFFLGKALFSEPSLSRSGTVSCRSCHNNNSESHIPSLYGFHRQKVFFRHVKVSEKGKNSNLLPTHLQKLPVQIQASLFPIFTELGHTNDVSSLNEKETEAILSKILRSLRQARSENPTYEQLFQESFTDIDLEKADWAHIGEALSYYIQAYYFFDLTSLKTSIEKRPEMLAGQKLFNRMKCSACHTEPYDFPNSAWRIGGLCVKVPTLVYDSGSKASSFEFLKSHHRSFKDKKIERCFETQSIILPDLDETKIEVLVNYLKNFKIENKTFVQYQ